jgi:hypothetical protein
MKQTLFVIFADPQKQITSGACYIALDGYPTVMRSKAAGFQSFADAKAFAEENRIALNGLTYIDLDDFTDVDLKGSEAFSDSGSERGAHDDAESSGCATSEMETASISKTL